MVHLRPDSTLDEVVEAMREAGVGFNPDDPWVSGATSHYTEHATADRSSFLDDVTERIESWTLEYERASWSTGRTFRVTHVLIDRAVGGLYGGEGSAYTDRYLVAPDRDGDLECAVEAIARGCVPRRVASEEY